MAWRGRPWPHTGYRRRASRGSAKPRWQRRGPDSGASRGARWSCREARRAPRMPPARASSGASRRGGASPLPASRGPRRESRPAARPSAAPPVDPDARPPLFPGCAEGRGAEPPARAGRRRRRGPLAYRRASRRRRRGCASWVGKKGPEPFGPQPPPLVEAGNDDHQFDHLVLGHDDATRREIPCVDLRARGPLTGALGSAKRRFGRRACGTERL